jgi:hypothetical protein
MYDLADDATLSDFRLPAIKARKILPGSREASDTVEDRPAIHGEGGAGMYHSEFVYRVRGLRYRARG